MRSKHAWWQTGIIYQIYPRSFQDSNGDGVGDLAGITSRLDYLQWLGIDAIWISPIYPSPMADFGYDVSDYTDIHPLFGTLDDFDRLVAEANRRDIGIILDYVPNHTSELHPWFIESRASRDNPKRDWYIWRDAKPDGSPPNNWVSHFGGGAWEWDETTGQFYLHSFLKEQPDLNWRNKGVQEAMLGALRFWLERGVDGFRVDVMWETVKDEQLRDNPPNPAYKPGVTNPYFSVLPLYNHDRPETHEQVRMMRRVLDEYANKVMIGEIYLPFTQLVSYYGTANAPEAHMPANFHLLMSPWDARRIERLIIDYEAELPDHAWPNWVLGNHDRPRIATKAGPEQAGVAAILLLTLRGTPTMYYQDELGLEDVPIPPDRVQDPVEHNVPGMGLGRDPERTPMQWDASANAGFSTGDPWLPLSTDWQTRNVAAMRDDPASILHLYKRLIELRRAEPALTIGSIAHVSADDTSLAYVREQAGRRFLVAVNLAGEPSRLDCGDLHGRVIVGTRRAREGDEISGKFELAGNEGVVAFISD